MTKIDRIVNVVDRDRGDLGFADVIPKFYQILTTRRSLFALSVPPSTRLSHAGIANPLPDIVSFR